MTIGLGHYLTVAAILFTLGVFGIFINRKNVIIILMSVELILLAVNINLVAFSVFLGDMVGQVFAMFVLTVAAAEAAIVAGLGNRMLGNLAAKLITTGALFVSLALSWPIFLGFLAGTQTSQLYPVLGWIHSGGLVVDWALRVDALTSVMLVVVTTV